MDGLSLYFYSYEFWYNKSLFFGKYKLSIVEGNKSVQREDGDVSGGMMISIESILAKGMC